MIVVVLVGMICLQHIAAIFRKTQQNRNRPRVNKYLAPLMKGKVKTGADLLDLLISCPYASAATLYAPA